MSLLWVRLAISDSSFLSGILLHAARHLSLIKHAQYDCQKLVALAVQYKLDCIENVSKSISFSSKTSFMPFSNSIVAEVLILAADEVSFPGLVMVMDIDRPKIALKTVSLTLIAIYSLKLEIPRPVKSIFSVQPECSK